MLHLNLQRLCRGGPATRCMHSPPSHIHGPPPTPQDLRWEPGGSWIQMPWFQDLEQRNLVYFNRPKQALPTELLNSRDYNIMFKSVLSAVLGFPNFPFCCNHAIIRRTQLMEKTYERNTLRKQQWNSLRILKQHSFLQFVVSGEAIAILLTLKKTLQDLVTPKARMQLNPRTVTIKDQ